MCMTNYNLSNKTLFFDKLIFSVIYTKSCQKSTPKGRHIYVYQYHVNVRTPSGPMSQRKIVKLSKITQIFKKLV